MSKLDELRALEAAATPGPWELGDYFIQSQGENLLQRYAGTIPFDAGSQRQIRANPPLIVAARNALPALLDCAEALREIRPDEGVEMDDPRLKYITVQISRKDAARAIAALRELEGM